MKRHLVYAKHSQYENPEMDAMMATAQIGCTMPILTFFVDKAIRTAQKFSVRDTPTLLLLEGDRVVARLSGQGVTLPMVRAFTLVRG